METTNTTRFPLSNNNGKTFSKYLIDADGRLWAADTGEEVAWQREAAADLCKGSKDRLETTGKRRFSRLEADDGTNPTVGRAEAIACSVPDIAKGKTPGTVIVFLDGDSSNETAANLRWGAPFAKVAAECKNKAAGTGRTTDKLLSIEDVEEILASFDPNDPSCNTRFFAERFGVAMATINNVTTCKTFIKSVDRKKFDNPYIAKESYFKTYKPGPKAKVRELYIKLGRPVMEATEPAPAEGAEQQAAPETAEPAGQAAADLTRDDKNVPQAERETFESTGRQAGQETPESAQEAAPGSAEELATGLERFLREQDQDHDDDPLA